MSFDIVYLIELIALLNENILFRCEATQCERLPLVSHAIAEGTGRNVGDLVAYSCHRGYSLTGAPVLTCLDNGLWDRPVPECTGIYRSICPLKLK